MNKAGQRASIAAHGRDPVDSRSPLDDRELVLEAQRGDRDAFKTLFERHHRRAYALAFGVLRHPDDAMDVVQDAFVKAHRYLDKFEGNSSFYTWLYRIVMNLAIDHLRKHRRVKSVELDETRLDSESDEPLLPRILGGNPGRALIDKQIRARIDKALDELSDNHRSVLVMRELEGMSYEEMAHAMSCSKGTIMSRLFHARRNMQKQLLDLLDHPSPELIEELTGDRPAPAAGAGAADAGGEDDADGAPARPPAKTAGSQPPVAREAHEDVARKRAPAARSR